MSIAIGSNIASLSAQRQLASNTDALGSIYERLSSGQRINRASDDAAGLAVSESLRTDSRVFQQGIRNVNDSISVLNIAASAIEELKGIVFRMQELATQAASGTLDDSNREVMDKELTELEEEYQRILESTEFNGTTLLGDNDSGINVQTGGSTLSLTLRESEEIESYVSSGTGAYTTQFSDQAGFGLTGGDYAAGPIFLVGDFNSDGFDDLVAAATEHESKAMFGATISINTYLGSSNGLVAADTTSFQTDDPVGAEPAGFVDFNMDWVGSTFEIQFNIRAAKNNINESGNVLIGADGSIGGYTAVGDTGGGGVGANNIAGDFNGDGVADRALETGSNEASYLVQLQNTTQTLSSSITAFTSLSLDSQSIATRSDALTALDSLGEQLTLLSDTVSRLGAGLSRLSVTSNVLQAQVTGYSEAYSRITDADIAAEVSRLTRNQILQQAGSAVLAQANLQPSLALQLLS